MKISALLGVFAVTVVVLAVAWAVCLNPDRDSLLPLGVGVLIGYGIQVFGWRSLAEFPEAHAKLLRIALPLSATLISVPLGLFVFGFFAAIVYPGRTERVVWDAGMSFGFIGLPALVVGLVLLLVCRRALEKGAGDPGGNGQ